MNKTPSTGSSLQTVGRISSFQPVDRPISLSELAYQQLRAGILAGDFKTNGRVSVVTVAEQLSISRSPVRAAVERLSAEGLITIATSGIELVDYNLQDLLDTLEVRRPLEATASGRLARAATSEQRSALVTQHENFVAAVDRGADAAAYGFDVGLHAKIWAMCGNRVLEQELQRLQARGIVASYTLSWTPLHVEAVTEHSAIIDAIIAGDSEAAEAAALRHMDGLIGRVRDGVAKPYF